MEGELIDMRETRVLTAIAAVLTPVAAGAAEGGAAWSPFQGDLGNFLWTLITLLVVYWVLKKYAWTPLLEALQGREKFIEESLEQAVRDRDDARALLRDYEEKLAAARSEVEALLEEGRRDAAALREREEERARQEGKQMIARARREIEVATDTAVKDLYERAAALSTAAAGRILGREIQAADHERLVDEVIEALDRPAGDDGESPAAH